MRKVNVFFGIIISAFLLACDSKPTKVEDSKLKVQENTTNTDMATKFWDERYADSSYVYGEAPNRFFDSVLQTLTPGIILLPAEGEGRNAVAAAKLGWQVDAFDISAEGKKKALRLADKRETKINYTVSGFDDFKADRNFYDAIGLIYAHVPAEDRKAYYQKCVAWLKPGGTLIFEGFSKQQLGKNSGGPKKEAMLFALEELKEELAGLKFGYAEELDILLSEGEHHTGIGSVVRIVAKK